MCVLECSVCTQVYIYYISIIVLIFIILFFLLVTAVVHVHLLLYSRF
jgi:hypothetical protein